MRAALTTFTEAWVAHRQAELALPPGQPSPPLPAPPPLLANASFLATVWYTNATNYTGAASPRATTFLQLLRTTPNYPWLMNYLRSNGAWGQYGGYLPGSTGVMPEVGARVVSRCMRVC
jgi:hypothetical protein